MPDYSRVTLPLGYSPWDTRGDCWFDNDAALRAIRFIQSQVSHVKGQRGKLILEQWQKNFIATLFGWKRPDGTRRYRTVYLEIPRKAGKSLLCAAIALYVLYCDNEPGAEVYSCASEREQAAIVFEMALNSVEQNPLLRRRSKIFKRSIITGGCKYVVLSAQAFSKHGYNPHCVIFDELHAQPNRELWDVMRSGMGARRQPLMIALTTAGWDRYSICFEVYTQAKNVALGKENLNHVLPCIYEADATADWTKEETWRQAQPNLGISVPVSFYHDECEVAKASPSKENTFRQLYLNQWTEQSERWFSLRTWTEQAPRRMMEVCHQFAAGVDLASHEDIAALVLATHHPAGGYDLFPYFWCPEDTTVRRQKIHGIPYLDWVRSGYLRTQPGEVLDMNLLADEICAILRERRVKHVCYDPWGSVGLIPRFEAERIEGKKFHQTFTSYNAPCQLFDATLTKRMLRHGHDPVLTWMAGNVHIERDSNDQIKPAKGKSSDKIDGIVAAIMAVAALESAPKKRRSIYEEGGSL